MRLAVNVFSLLPWWIVGVSLALLVSVSHAVEEESLGENLQEIPLSSGVRHSPAAHSRQLANLLLHTPSLQKKPTIFKTASVKDRRSFFAISRCSSASSCHLRSSGGD
mmetsp:Transcript_23272/g.36409  ORF Transcript_23272/g.36409 Transcript_23272/m.36409 type:complete len:108 (-) Transcript_23272:244-567(-)